MGSRGETYNERSKGRDVRTSNIVAAKVRGSHAKHERSVLLSLESPHSYRPISGYPIPQAIANAVRTSLGPRGMDKLLQLPGGENLITNDGYV